MGSGEEDRLNKKIVFDPEFKLDRICWVLDTACPVCSEPLEVVFDEHPTEIEILETEQIPCDDCLGRAGKDDVMDAVIKELFDRQPPDRK